MRVGLALSGGGARGIAHLGMIKALEESGVAVHRISGTSAGAIIGSLYANGIEVKEILQILGKTNFLSLFRPSLSSGFFKLDSAAKELKKYLGHDDFSELRVPLTVAATDFDKGETEYFSSGQIIKPVLASSSIPVLFSPIAIRGIPYVDGGITDNLPVKPLKEDCDFIIGLHTNPIAKGDFAKINLRDTVERSLLIAISSNTKNQSDECDLFIEPPQLINFRAFEVRRLNDLYEAGYRHASDVIENQKLPWREKDLKE